MSRSAAPQAVQLDLASREALAQSLAGDDAAALVIRRSEHGKLLRFDDLIVDRGDKSSERELVRIVLSRNTDNTGNAKVPLIGGNYTTPGRAVQSVTSLLARVHRARQQGTRAIIAVADTDFESLWKGTWTEATKGRAGARARRLREAAWGTVATASSRDLLDGLPHEQIPKQLYEEQYIGKDPHVELVRQLIMKAARVDDPVLIIGPTGTGKENVARAIHAYSRRATEPFVAANVNAIAPTLFEGELFGHLKGAFTGAMRDSLGLWRTARRGTLLLDEIGDLDKDLQKKVLRVLDAGEVRPVGATREEPVNARIIAATNRDLFSMVQHGQFRSDLYYRLRTILIPTPALHEHSGDIEQLAHHFWKRITNDAKALVPAPIVRRLTAYRWPGNVRELKSVLAALFALFRTAAPRAEDLDLVFALQGQTVAEPDDGPAGERSVTLHRAECLRHLRRADEVIRACEVTLRPLLKQKLPGTKAVHAVRDALRYRLQELETLNLHPLLFHSERTFTAVHAFEGKLGHFHRLLKKEVAEALGYWEKEVAEACKLALSAIFEEVERVMAGA
jgi:DNA-binding NtrC family response regulator